MQSIHSPSTCLVFSSMDSLSPPPTPGRKRATRTLPKNATDNNYWDAAMPMFFPSANSLLSDETIDGHDVETSLEAFVRRTSSSPPAKMTLLARPLHGTKITRHQIPTLPTYETTTTLSAETLSMLPPLPFASPDENSSFSPPSSSSPARKLPSFQKGGMSPPQRALRRRNCYVARSA
mmetsp:Transcript_806/g.1605  ORF Transcript_806/g.1605 Transcript_806/m.1605 type:complete len:178 (-) Transcript_806:216-749(-)